jgi:transcriptional regulator
MGGNGLKILKGTLEILILKTLHQGPNHGYGIVRWLKEISSEEFQIEEGALYPALRKLEKRGLIASAWEVTDTGREAKFYHLTPVGEEALDEATANWDRYVHAMDSVMRPAGDQ